ncbi:MAG TPA: hypothetical protein VND94_17250 [Terriglobia bacterium]|nr:hypothetical protein [Terriglobia bacterium]
MRKLRFSCLVFGIFLVSAEASAQSVTLAFDWSDERWAGYPDNEGPIQSYWDGDTLRVSTIVDWESGTAIDASSARVTIQSERNMSICYKKSIVHQNSGQPALTATSPVILRFTVADVPKKIYNIKIFHDCKD